MINPTQIGFPIALMIRAPFSMVCSCSSGLLNCTTAAVEEAVRRRDLWGSLGQKPGPQKGKITSVRGNVGSALTLKEPHAISCPGAGCLARRSLEDRPRASGRGKYRQ